MKSPDYHRNETEREKGKIPSTTVDFKSFMSPPQGPEVKVSFWQDTSPVKNRSCTVRRLSSLLNQSIVPLRLVEVLIGYKRYLSKLFSRCPKHQRVNGRNTIPDLKQVDSQGVVISSQGSHEQRVITKRLIRIDSSSILLTERGVFRY